MTYYVIKLIITVILIVLISEVARRSTLIGGILASVPLISVMAMIWLYIDTKDTNRIIVLSSNIFWLVLPSLALFLILPMLLRREFNFYSSMGIAILITIICYYIMIILLGRFGIKL